MTSRGRKILEMLAGLNAGTSVPTLTTDNQRSVTTTVKFCKAPDNKTVNFSVEEQENNGQLGINSIAAGCININEKSLSPSCLYYIPPEIEHHESSLLKTDQNIGVTTDLPNCANVEKYAVIGTNLIPIEGEGNIFEPNIQENASNYIENNYESNSQLIYHNLNQISQQGDEERGILPVTISSRNTTDVSSCGEYSSQPNSSSSDESKHESDPETRKRRRVMPIKGAGKKRYRNEKNWKRSVAKANKNSGKSYINTRGREVKGREMRKACNEKCRKNCSKYLSENQRKVIFEKFWLMGDYNRQSSFVGKYVKRIPKKRQILKLEGQESRRTSNSMYNLPNDNTDTEVCKTMFLNTLEITDMWVTTALQKKESSEIGEITPDKRGSHDNRPNRIPEETRNRIKEHIEMFPTIESHYCRSRSKKRYLEQGLNISKMYRFYIEWLKENKYEISGTERQYREIFNREYNISFWVPKKDMCDICYAYSIKVDKSEEDEIVHLKHLENKEIVRRLKEIDKQNSDRQLSTGCFDLQKVILIPQKEASQFYYKCKLSVYNFTIFECSTREGFCFIWTEQIAKRGANETASCLLYFIKNMAENGKKILHLYSDNCAGQNKNKFIVLMYLYAAKRYKIDIVHRFFEQGHSQNENDSIHALIEKTKQGQDIFTPDQFIMIAKLSKIHGKPYVVKEMTQDDFLDFRVLEKKYSNLCKDTENNKISWNSIREFTISCEDLDKVQIRYDLAAEKIITLNLGQPRRNIKRKKVEEFCEEPARAYSQLIGLPKKKYDHLKYLSSKIPAAYKQFYDSLTCATNSRSDSDSDDE